jgi:ankyrin repeat protein
MRELRKVEVTGRHSIKQQRRHLDVVKALIKAKTKIDERDNGQFTPLRCAASYGYLRYLNIVKELIA